MSNNSLKNKLFHQIFIQSYYLKNITRSNPYLEIIFLDNYLTQSNIPCLFIYFISTILLVFYLF